MQSILPANESQPEGVGHVPIVYRKGNVFEKSGRLAGGELTIVAHQCNCRGSFDAGIAREIARRFPEVDRAQRLWYQEGRQRLGTVQTVRTHTGLVIANLYAQEDWVRRPNRINTDYSALEQCLATLRDGMTAEDVLGMPKIGAGLGGGDWNVIEQLIERIFQDRTVYVYVL